MRQACSTGLFVVALVSSASAAFATDAAIAAVACGAGAEPDEVAMAYRGVSPAVRALPPSVAGAARKRWLGDLELDREGASSVVDADGVRFGTGTPKVDDPVAGRPRTDGEPVAPEPVVDLDGLSSIIVGPPDTEGAVGPDHYVQAVNIQFRVFDKQGEPLTDPIASNSLWAGTGSGCEGDLYADPIVMYDEAADRWVLSYISLDLSSGFLWACVAVSTGGDPTGGFFLYELEAPRIPDYPKLAVWPDPVHNAYVMGTIPIPDPQGKHDVYVLDRESLLAGVEPRPTQRFIGFPNLLMPADVDGPPPPPGSPALLYTFRDGGESFFIPPSPVDSLDVYELRVDWDNPTASRLTLAQSITPPELAEFNWTVCGWNDPDAERPELESQRLGKGVEPRLGGAVGAETRPRMARQRAGNGDDAARPTLDHPRRHRLGAVVTDTMLTAVSHLPRKTEDRAPARRPPGASPRPRG